MVDKHSCTKLQRKSMLAICWRTVKIEIKNFEKDQYFFAFQQNMVKNPATPENIYNL
jgi:hypothetical protein